ISRSFSPTGSAPILSARILRAASHMVASGSIRSTDLVMISCICMARSPASSGCFPDGTRLGPRCFTTLPRKSLPVSAPKEPAAAMAEPPLEGLSVRELARILAGPWAGQMLADLGAGVIKGENPQGGDDTRRRGPPVVVGADGDHLWAA